MLKTKSGLPKHCSWNTDRHGKRRVRFRRAGFTTYLVGIPWSEDFMRQYAAAQERLKAQAGNIGGERTKPGSVNALCVSYYRSPEYRGLKTSTQTKRRQIIERFRNEHGDKSVADLERKHIKSIIGARANTPEGANNFLKVLRLLLGYAVSIDMIQVNPSLGVKRYKAKGEGYHWTEGEIKQFEAHHPIGSRARLALALLLYTAQRRSDVVRMGWQHVRGDEIAVRQEKTDTPLLIPMHPDLVLVLTSVPRTNLTFLLNELGAAFASETFGKWFRRQCDAAGLPHCSAHGLRKAAATRLANAGCSMNQIRAITGHRSLAQVEPYVRAADQQRLARGRGFGDAERAHRAARPARVLHHDLRRERVAKRQRRSVRPAQTGRRG
jgi:integrase